VKIAKGDQPRPGRQTFCSWLDSGIYISNSQPFGIDTTAESIHELQVFDSVTNLRFREEYRRGVFRGDVFRDCDEPTTISSDVLMQVSDRFRYCVDFLVRG
jgi:hypothetical protein